MNKLSYGLLSLLSTEPMSGYDLTQKLNKFWRSTHSAIYPILSKLEEEGYIQLTLKKQSGKPDKKIYNLTVKGNELLHDWFISETNEEVTRDEMTLKLYCIKFMDEEAVEKLLNELETKVNKRIEQSKESIEKIKLKFKENPETAKSSLFGAYILTQRNLNVAKLNLQWCEWVRNLYENKELDFLEEDFNLDRMMN
ncbi:MULTISPECIES: PadR family transcriptional regulator [Clostridium]|uniref:PadR family transcriptional regulator n=1 Tax=Clostridium TaxID=1485 RepID=UPI00189B7E7C|nr:MULTISPECIES: PadR family transcriptional regulator [Clostridium]MDI9217905.1 PadR family transcriptional regulator [Clostridium tertium]